MTDDTLNTIDVLHADLEQITLVQITDTHLFSDPDSSLLGVQTEPSFHAVVESVKQTTNNYQAVIMTGDVSQDHSYESYQRFADGIKPLTTNKPHQSNDEQASAERPCYWLPGNHDNQPNMHQLSEVHIKATPQVLMGKHWQLILLDSQVDGSPHGYLSEQQFTILENALQAHPDRYALVLMHHHSLLVGSAWLDGHCLHNREEFWQRIAPFTSKGKSQVKGVVCGHVHQDFHQSHQGVEVITSPATCMQFKPQSDLFGLDNKAPGWRSLTLNSDGSIETQVYRLPEGSFLPDEDAEGY